jgi:hypothetical protein
MLRPHPESDLSMNILVLGSEIIEMLDQKKTFVVVEHVMEAFLEKDIRRTPDTFLDIITLLFALGLVESRGYRIKVKKNDLAEATLF